MTSKKLLQGLYSLDHNIKLYIPSTTDIDKPIDNNKYVLECSKLFSSLFGGATTYQAKGSWLSDIKGLVIENITIVESYGTKEQVNNGLEAVIKYALTIKKELGQEAISLEYDNKLYFV